MPLPSLFTPLTSILLCFSLSACSGELSKDTEAPGRWGNDSLQEALVRGVCDTARVELPLVTHYDANSKSHRYMATDSASLFALESPIEELGTCNSYYSDGFLPATGVYLADQYTHGSRSDATVRAFSNSLCEQTGIAIDILQPDAFESRDVVGRLRSESGTTQIITPKIIDGSLVTIILPPNWSAQAPAGTYPIAANGFYDVHSNLFSGEGERWTLMTTLSGTQERTGVIGVLWNGGGAIGSVTANRAAYRQFNSVVSWVSENLGGDRNQITMSGGSRGGLTAMAMASNPYDYDYKVVFAGASVPVGLLGTAVGLMSTTYPKLIGFGTSSVGLTDIAQPGWTYPDCGREEYFGLSPSQAFLQVVAGTSDLSLADAEMSPASPQFIEGLRKAGTKVSLVISSSDDIVPFSTQVVLGARLLAAGIPLQAEVLVRGGHTERHEAGLLGLQPVRFTKMVEALLPRISSTPEVPFESVVDYFRRIDNIDDSFEAFTPERGNFPFSVDMPYRTARGDRFPLVFVGHPNTEFIFKFTDPAGKEVAALTGVIGSDFSFTQWVDVPAGFPVGSYGVSLSIRPKGISEWKLIPSTATVGGENATVTVEEVFPKVGTDELKRWAKASSEEDLSTTWSLSEY